MNDSVWDRHENLLPTTAWEARPFLAEVRTSFARNVRIRREAIHATQAGVANVMWAYGFESWRQSTLAKVEAGERAVKLDEAFALAALYGIPLDDLLRGIGLYKNTEGFGKGISMRNHPSRTSATSPNA